MVIIYWQCSKNTSPGPYFCLHKFETEEDEQAIRDKTVTATCPVCNSSLTMEDSMIGVNYEPQEKH